MSSNLIKARTLEATVRPVIVKRDVQIACRQADEIVASAEDEAQQILTEARRNAQDILASARDEGYQNGAAQWYEALTSAWTSRDAYLAANETALLRLAVRIAEKLIGAELHVAPAAISGIVAEALRSVRRARTLAIQAHPADITALEESLTALGTPGGATRSVEVIPNASLSRGGCIVETELGIIDARLETQLKNVERVLTAKAAT
jgi:flagellar biosynthesis/type III secretory pathway protein FliH